MIFKMNQKWSDIRERMNFLKITVFWLMLAFLSWFVSFRLGYFFGLGAKKIIVFLIIFIVGIWIQVHRKLTNKDGLYWKKLLGLDKVDPSRDARYDWLRFLALVLVITAHTSQAGMSYDIETDSIQYYFLNIIYVLSALCNSLYVMLSGALLLTYREEKLSDFYLKRASKAAVPLLCYYVFYLWQNKELNPPITAGFVLDVIGRIFSGNTPESPHYWLLFVILSLYLVFPFFRYTFKNMPYKMITNLVILCIIAMGAFVYSQVFLGMTPIVNTFLCNWIGVAIIGYWVTRPETAKYKRLLIMLGLIAAIFAFFLVAISDDFEVLCCNCTPIMQFMAMAVFTLFFHCTNLFKKNNHIIAITGKYNYGIILLHWWTLYWIVRGMMNITFERFSIFICFVLSILTNLLVSFVVAFVMDNLVVAVPQWIIAGILSLKKRSKIS